MIIFKNTVLIIEQYYKLVIRFYLYCHESDSKDTDTADGSPRLRIVATPQNF